MARIRKYDSGLYILEIDTKYIREYCGRFLYQLDGNYIKDYNTGKYIYQIDGDRIRDYCGGYLLEFDGRRIKRFCGPYIYEIDKDKIKDFKKRALNIGNNVTRGTSQTEDIYFQNTEVRSKYYLELPDLVNDKMKEFSQDT